jgi:hypothetical protein
MTEFLTDLFYKVFNKDDRKMKEWIADFLGEEVVELSCSHKTNIPEDYEMCSYFKNVGTNEKKKGMLVRKTTVWSSANKYLGTKVSYNKSSTKIDVCQLSIFLRYTDNIKDLLKEWKENEFIICHSCGCGALEEKSCTVPKHLYLGSNKTNNEDTHYHKLLKSSKINESDYKELRKILYKCNKDTF